MVVEVVVTAALEVEIPIEQGDDIHAGIAAVLGEIDGVRHVVVEEVGDVTSVDSHLRVEVYAQVTLHFTPELFDPEEKFVRERLAGAEAVGGVSAFEIASGPYRIETW